MVCKSLLLWSRKERRGSRSQPLSPRPQAEVEAARTSLPHEEDNAGTSATSSSSSLGCRPASAKLLPIAEAALFPPLEEKAAAGSSPSPSGSWERFSSYSIANEHRLGSAPSLPGQRRCQGAVGRSIHSVRLRRSPEPFSISFLKKEKGFFSG